MGTAFTKEELMESLRLEVHILVHLAGKVEPEMTDYRPTPKQRSTIELLRYLTVMGPELARGIRAGGFDETAWGAAMEAAGTMDLQTATAALQKQSAQYEDLLAGFSEEDLRGTIEMFGQNASRGFFLVNLVLSGCAAYRMQLFLYLKACGREDLNSMNLWAGIDAPAAS